MYTWLLGIVSVLVLLGISFLFWTADPQIDMPRLASNQIEDAGFEGESSDAEMPKGWEASIQSGTYRCRLTKRQTVDDFVGPDAERLEYCRSSKRFASSGKARAGDYALEFAGTGGAASIHSSPFEMSGKGFVECAVWLKREFNRDAGCSIDLELSHGHFIEDIESLENDSGSIQAGSKGDGWRKLTLFKEFEAENSDEKLRARMGIHLTGEALLRIDDVETYVYEQSMLIQDGGFEQLDSEGGLVDWNVATEDGKKDFQRNRDDVHGGTNCIRLIGNDKWKVLYSREVPLDQLNFIVQAYVRVHDGLGGVKIEYSSRGPRIEQTCLIPETEGWTRIRLASKPELMQSARSFRVTLVASRPDNDCKQYSVDFDDIRVFIAK